MAKFIGQVVRSEGKLPFSRGTLPYSRGTLSYSRCVELVPDEGAGSVLVLCDDGALPQTKLYPLHLKPVFRIRIRLDPFHIGCPDPDPFPDLISINQYHS